MLVPDDIIYRPRFFNPRKPKIKKLISRNKSNRMNLVLPRRKKTGSFNTAIQEKTNEDSVLKDITIESDSNVVSVGSGDSSTTVATMDTSFHNTKCHHMGGTSAHVHLYHNSSL